LNSLNLKEFSVSTAPEVGRIIDVWDLPSTSIFIFLSHWSKKPANTKADPKGSAFVALLFYI
ncbi:hypothetical protein, partial [Pseudomonas rustica]